MPCEVPASFRLGDRPTGPVARRRGVRVRPDGEGLRPRGNSGNLFQVLEALDGGHGLRTRSRPEALIAPGRVATQDAKEVFMGHLLVVGSATALDVISGASPVCLRKLAPTMACGPSISCVSSPCRCSREQPRTLGGRYLFHLLRSGWRGRTGARTRCSARARSAKSCCGSGARAFGRSQIEGILARKAAFSPV